MQRRILFHGVLFTANHPLTKTIIFIAWKDNAFVLMMTIVKGGLEPKQTLRKRPKETSTLAKMSRVLFGDQATKVLPIPEILDKYNHKIEAVNRGNNLRASYTMQRSI